MVELALSIINSDERSMIHDKIRKDAVWANYIVNIRDILARREVCIMFSNTIVGQQVSGVSATAGKPHTAATAVIVWVKNTDITLCIPVPVRDSILSSSMIDISLTLAKLWYQNDRSTNVSSVHNELLLDRLTKLYVDTYPMQMCHSTSQSFVAIFRRLVFRPRISSITSPSMPASVRQLIDEEHARTANAARHYNISNAAGTSIATIGADGNTGTMIGSYGLSLNESKNPIHQQLSRNPFTVGWNDGLLSEVHAGVINHRCATFESLCTLLKYTIQKVAIHRDDNALTALVSNCIDLISARVAPAPAVTAATTTATVTAIGLRGPDYTTNDITAFITQLLSIINDGAIAWQFLTTLHTISINVIDGRGSSTPTGIIPLTVWQQIILFATKSSNLHVIPKSIIGIVATIVGYIFFCSLHAPFQTLKSIIIGARQHRRLYQHSKYYWNVVELLNDAMVPHPNHICHGVHYLCGLL
jgi:hypothetical protein